MKQPEAREANLSPAIKAPELVIETWVSRQLRDRIQRHGISLAEDLQAPETPAHPQYAELEAEP